MSCLTLLQPHGLQPASLLCSWNSPGKNTGVGCHFFLQRIFPTQGLDLYLLHWQGGSLPLHHQESPVCQLYLSKTGRKEQKINSSIINLKRLPPQPSEHPGCPLWLPVHPSDIHPNLSGNYSYFHFHTFRAALNLTCPYVPLPSHHRHYQALSNGRNSATFWKYLVRV